MQPSKLSLRGHKVATAAALLALGVLYLPVFAHAVDVWSADQEFSFGFFVPPSAIVLIWLRRNQIRGALGRGSDWALILLSIGLAVFLAGARSGIHALSGASFALTTLGVVAFLYGIATARVLLFPVAFFTVSLCLFRGLLSSLGFTLQGLTARYAAGTAAMAGVPVTRSGVDLYAGQFHFVVAEACSGLSSLLALLCLGTLFVGLSPLSPPRRMVLIGLILPIVLIANIIRVSSVLVLAQTFGLGVAHGFIHGFFSAALFVAALGLFVLAGGALGCFQRIGATASS